MTGGRARRASRSSRPSSPPPRTHLTLPEVRASYRVAETLATALQPYVEDVLGQFAAQNRFLFSSRVKELSSYLQKLETGRSSSLVLDDLLACTIVVPALPDVDRCIASLPSRVQVIRRKGPASTDKDPEVFRYDDERLVCRMGPPTGVTATTGSIWTVEFELQIKTGTQFAWGQATHPLVYKGDEFDWRRVRLSSQLRALAEQADLLYAEFLDVAARITPSLSRRTSDLTRASGYLVSWKAHGLVPTLTAPPSTVRFAQSVTELARQTGVPTYKICRRVTRYLRRSGAPASISLFQLALALTIRDRVDAIKWGRIEGQYWLPITQEVVDLFPELGRVPATVCVRG